jgi:hypothetical protein
MRDANAKIHAEVELFGKFGNSRFRGGEEQLILRIMRVALPVRDPQLIPIRTLARFREGYLTRSTTSLGNIAGTRVQHDPDAGSES